MFEFVIVVIALSSVSIFFAHVVKIYLDSIENGARGPRNSFITDAPASWHVTPSGASYVCENRPRRFKIGPPLHWHFG